ncbi:uncharacterized protein LOC125498721 [Beta vulgaris subsp. vulgaris]|uniref:uncharacterized protein LOC125498721 n=1 Tax=Beta vulgaris subsp. vulgaris TaxID=3555 RepID=UPI002036D4F9|nr:uncharacterized protein LOC125498721 [Beta vulgaris subsp. vulgaris]
MGKHVIELETTVDEVPNWRTGGDKRGPLSRSLKGVLGGNVQNTQEGKRGLMVGHWSQECQSSLEQVHAFQSFCPNNPYSNTHNPGLRNHPNLSYKSTNVLNPPAPQRQAQPLNQRYYQQPSQQPPGFSRPPFNPSPQAPPADPMMNQLAQLATLNSTRQQGALPPQSIQPTDSANAITLRSGSHYNGPPMLTDDIVSVNNDGKQVQDELATEKEDSKQVNEHGEPNEAKQHAIEVPPMKLPLPNRQLKSKLDQQFGEGSIWSNEIAAIEEALASELVDLSECHKLKSATLNNGQLSQLLTVLKTHKKAIGYSIDDLKGISPDFCMHRIHLEDDHKPCIQPQRRLNPNMQEVVNKEVMKLLDADYRRLNMATKKDHFPLPFIDQMLERLAFHKYFCYLDEYSGFFRIPIDPDDQEKRTFNCPYGTFAYRRMPFGLCNAPATFQRCMMSIFSEFIESIMEVFMDDFSVYGSTFDTCLVNITKVMKRCEECNLVLNWKKWHFMVTEGVVLGHIVSGKGIQVDRAKVQVIEQLPPPNNVKGVRSFLGHAGFYRRFNKDFSKIAKPLTQLLLIDAPFDFTDECLESFDRIKKALITAPIIRFPDWELPFEIMCDASDYAVGAVLSQRQDKVLHAIYYASKTLDEAQVNYATTENELLAIVEP